MTIKRYVLNCFLLLIPIFLWNILLVEHLPEQFSPAIFDKDIPRLISVSENVLRAMVLSLPILMILSVKTTVQKIGLVIYLLGVILYFASWVMVILNPQSDWSTSLIGFTAPAFTTIIWFIGIGLIGSKSYLKIPRVSLIYITLSILFTVIHTRHAYLVFQNY